MSYKSRILLEFLSAFPLTGMLGMDRIYMGQVGLGLLKLLTFGGLGVWYIVDMLIQTIEGIMRKPTTVADSEVTIIQSSVNPGFVFGIVIVVLIVLGCFAKWILPMLQT